MPTELEKAYDRRDKEALRMITRLSDLTTSEVTVVKNRLY